MREPPLLLAVERPDAEGLHPGASAALARAYSTCTNAGFVAVCPAVSVTVRITFLLPFVA